jgi:hypothetical protein
VGFLDSLLGRSRPKVAKPSDRLFALSTAHITLEVHGLSTRGRAAIVFQPLATADFGSIVSEMEQVVRGTGEETGTRLEVTEDTYGYRWMILHDPDVEDLVVGVNGVGDALAIGGYGDRVLAAVFAFADAQGRPVHLIYNYKRGAWYPFVPSVGRAGEAAGQERDAERELQVKAIIGTELPIEPELERWFPLWGIPI